MNKKPLFNVSETVPVSTGNKHETVMLAIKKVMPQIIGCHYLIETKGNTKYVWSPVSESMVKLNEL